MAKPAGSPVADQRYGVAPPVAANGSRTEAPTEPDWGPGSVTWNGVAAVPGSM
jgi:hypothetical protein